MKNEIPKQSFRELMHNLIGHPLLAICNAIGAYRLGTWIHDDATYTAIIEFLKNIEDGKVRDI